MAGVRRWAVNTNVTEDLDPNLINVHQKNTTAIYLSEEERLQKEKMRVVFLNDELLAQIRALPGVEAAEKAAAADPVSIDAFAKRPRPPWRIEGMPEALLRRYVSDPARLSVSSNSIPLIVGERLLRQQFDTKAKKYKLDAPEQVNTWIGREVVVTLGFNYTMIDRYTYDYAKKEFRELTDDELKLRREQVKRNNELQYDP